MVTLKESLLDDEEDMLNSNTAIIKSWCNKHIVPISSKGQPEDAYKIQNGKVIFTDSIYIDVNGEIPDYIKWDADSLKKYGRIDVFNCKLKTFKNFPPAMKHCILYCSKSPRDFTTMPKMDIADFMVLKCPGANTIKGLRGNISSLSIHIDNLTEFVAENDLVVENLTLFANKANFKLDTIKKLPKIERKLTLTTQLPSHTSYDILPAFKKLINNTPELEPLFKGEILKSQWDKNGELQVRL